jgi:hypothetical protein
VTDRTAHSKARSARKRPYLGGPQQRAAQALAREPLGEDFAITHKTGWRPVPVGPGSCVRASCAGCAAR